jgi:hypothetical protein
MDFCFNHGEMKPCPECPPDQAEDGSPHTPLREAPPLKGGPHLQGQENPHPLDQYILNGNDLERMAGEAERHWPIPSLIGPGLSLLAGSPKSGKTGLALQLAWAIASGENALGSILTHQGDVLYVAAESSMNDLQTRKADVWPLDGWPERLSLVPGEAVAQYEDGAIYPLLERWRERAERPTLIVMDTFRALVDLRYKGRRQGGQTDDYSMMRPYWRYANEKVPVLMIHHTSQQMRDKVGHWQDRIAGTNGLVGATDANMLLDSTREGTYLRAQGRYIPESSFQLMNMGRTWATFDVIEALDNLGGRMKHVLGVVASLGGEATTAEVEEKSDLPPATTRQYLSRLASKGMLLRSERGRYVITQMLKDIADGR